MFSTLRGCPCSGQNEVTKIISSRIVRRGEQGSYLPIRQAHEKCDWDEMQVLEGGPKHSGRKQIPGEGQEQTKRRRKRGQTTPKMFKRPGPTASSALLLAGYFTD